MEVMTSHGSKYCCLFLTAPSITITLAKIRRMAQKITIIRLRLITLRLDRQYRRQRQTPTIFVNPYKNILISQKIFGIINRYLPTHSTAPDKGPNHQILAKNSSIDNSFLSSIFVISRYQLLTISLTNGVDTISLTTGTCQTETQVQWSPHPTQDPARPTPDGNSVEIRATTETFSCLM